MMTAATRLHLKMIEDPLPRLNLKMVIIDRVVIAKTRAPFGTAESNPDGPSLRRTKRAVLAHWDSRASVSVAPRAK